MLTISYHQDLVIDKMQAKEVNYIKMQAKEVNYIKIQTKQVKFI